MVAKPLRFAALVRVSTEKQEKQGESLRTQTDELNRSSVQLGGKIVESYGGQEHGTPGHEKKEVDRLLADARHNRFDAVIVANADRWSRDNAKSQQGLEVLKEHGIRFFVGLTEYSLHNPEHVLFLGMSAVIGRFQASHQNKKSIENRIERARKRGIPTGGRLPFGRTFDKEKEQWGIDDDKQEMIAEVARRYLVGESLAALAAEKRINHSFLHKVLTQRCGTSWQLEFNSDDLNIHETVEIQIPRLLDDKTIKAVQQRTQANKTYLHGSPKHKYLFGGMVFCGRCGYVMFGQTNHNGHRYYRHAHTKRDRICTCQPRPWVRADELEDVVMKRLFEEFGNVVAMERAIEEAIPNREKVTAARKRLEVIDVERKKVSKAKQRILGHISSDAITDAEAEAEFVKLKLRDDKLEAESETLTATLENVPSAESMKAVSQGVAKMFRDIRPGSVMLWVKRMSATHDFDRMTWEEARKLAEKIFNGTTSDGKPAGIYIFPVPGQQDHRRKAWRFRLHGLTPIDGIYCVTKSTSC